MELYLESPFNVDVDIMPPSEVEKLFRAFAEERKRALPQFTPDGIPITMENKFDDAIYNYLYAYWKEQSGEYDPKDDEIIMTKESSFTKNEKKFEQWLFAQYGMTKKEQRGYTLEGNLDSLWEIFSAADMVLLVKALPNIGKNLAKLGKNVGDDVAEEAIEKTVKKEAAEEMADTAEDLSQKTIDKDDVLEGSSGINRGSDSLKNKIPDNESTTGHIFRDAEGHIPDTIENRKLLEDVANNPDNFLGKDKYGNEWYAKLQDDGSQVWVEARNGKIFEGGVNNISKTWNPQTGLKKP